MTLLPSINPGIFLALEAQSGVAPYDPAIEITSA
jgi:hypothetical protein